MAKNKNPQFFGGDWTKEKLEILKGYLESYSSALKNQNFKRIYIDAFSGTGYINVPRRKADNENQNFLFSDMRDSKAEDFFAGSAKIALEVDIPFDKYIFVEKSPSRSKHLQQLKEEFSKVSIDIHQEDANIKIQYLCNSIDWRKNRAVVFIDPCGIDVE